MTPPTDRPPSPDAPDAPDDPAEVDDVDLTLRHVAHQFPEALAHALLPGARRITRCAWRDTQLSTRERRMDKSLYVVADGVARIEHVEWQSRWTHDLLLRVYEYHCLTTLALHAAAPRGKRVPRVRSTVVLLGGRTKLPWPPRMRFRASPPGEPFSGLRVCVDAVYQRTVDELTRRGAPLWSVFAPLAVDATPAAMVNVLDGLRDRSTPREFEELAVAMTVLADADSRRRGLRAAIASHLPEELVMQSWVYKQGLDKGRQDGQEEGRREGRQEGRREGRQEGRREGRQQGRQEGLRRSIALALSVRGLHLDEGARARLDAEARVDVLEAWLARAVTAPRIADVFAPG
jgi:hypothetical protein